MALPVSADYTNFEVGHVHPLALTPSGSMLLVVNTPDAVLEQFTILPDGSLNWLRSVPVGLEPVSVTVRSDTEAWVVNHLSDTVSVVNLSTGMVSRSLAVGDEPVDVAFAAGRAFVASSREDRVQVFDLASLNAPPASIDIFSREPRALAVSPDGSRVYVVALKAGNQTSVIGTSIIFNNNDTGHDNARLAALGLNPLECSTPPPGYPPLPPGVSRSPALQDPPSFFDPNGQLQPGVPPVGLIVRWNEAAGAWQDDAGQDWSDCLPFRLPDQDLFIIDAATLAVTPVPHLGTSLFDVSVNPANGRIYVPHTEARNFVRFEHAAGVAGHVVDNRLAVVEPAAGNGVTLIDLNGHLDRSGGPTGSVAERAASISQPGMMAWRSDGSAAYMVGFGSGKLYRIDGTCLAPDCIFGADRMLPAAVPVGGGPSGVVLHEGHDRLYVLNRFSNSLALVDAGQLTLLEEVALHDASGPEVREGRRFLYDAAVSGYGDSSCGSCHLFGDMDGLAWDLGDPEGDLAAYSDPNDNVRFILPVGGQPTPCDESLGAPCATHLGFDPQKGPMATQTLRRMLEPLHWRFDRATMLDFNPAFVKLLGAPDIGPVAGKPAGLTALHMQMFRQFTLGIHFPPNPYRTVMDQPMGTPGDPVGIPLQGLPFTGNPLIGENLFLTHNSDAGQPCSSCHALPFGTAGGQEGGVTPTTPTSPLATALFNGLADGSPHSDLGVPHLRNMYEKFGPLFGAPLQPLPDRRAGFGFTHNGAIPDMGTFLSLNLFNLTADQVRHISAFQYAFPTGVRPSVGRQLTFQPGPAGDPATNPRERLLERLIQGDDPANPDDDLGDLANPLRHCDLVAATLRGGLPETYHLFQGTWLPDAQDEPPLTTAALRSEAETPVTFLCTPLGSGLRLGGDRDEDTHLNRDDCNPADAGAFGEAAAIQDLAVAGGDAASLSWSDQSAVGGPGMRYDVIALQATELRQGGLEEAGCLQSDLEVPSFTDNRAVPAPGNAFLYLSSARNSCGQSGYGTGGNGPVRDIIEPGICAGP